MNLLVCARCSERCDDVTVVAGPAVRCPACAHPNPFVRSPLFCVTGPSGTGKSTVARLVLDDLADRFVVLEQDVLWQVGLRDEQSEHRTFCAAWLHAGSARQTSRQDHRHQAGHARQQTGRAER